MRLNALRRFVRHGLARPGKATFARLAGTVGPCLAASACSAFAVTRRAVCEGEHLAPVAVQGAGTEPPSYLYRHIQGAYRAAKMAWNAAWRLLYQSIIFAPVLGAAPLLLLPLPEQYSRQWWRLAKYVIGISGACATKLAQWIATRPDLFPISVCAHLQDMQSKARVPKLSYSERVFKETFGEEWHKRLVLELDESSKEPLLLGCGCVGQVYLGTFDGKRAAIKVLQRDIASGIASDVSLLHVLAAIVEMVPSLQQLSLRESLEEFRGLMMRQLDLSEEARNLTAFRDNFSHRERFTLAPEEPLALFPAPVFCSKELLIESYEPGQLMSQYLAEAGSKDSSRERDIASRLLRAILKMVFIDNFIHADLHPGNIIYRKAGSKVELTFIDAGIVASLSREDRRNFLDLFRAVIQNDGHRVGELLIERSRHGTCADPAGFAAGVEALVADVHESGLSLGRISVAALLSSMLRLCYVHRVRLESRFASVIIAMGVAEGLARRLDPDIDILELAGPYVLEAAVADD